MTRIHVAIDIADAIRVLAFLEGSCLVARDNQRDFPDDYSVDDEIRISVIERFKEDLWAAFSNQAPRDEVDGAIKYLKGEG